jgi:hypothetical protein
MASSQTLEVLRSDSTQTRVVEDTLPETLADNQLMLVVDRFALTANNISYFQVGDKLGYWRFFPTSDPSWGRVPAMGYATVAASAHPDIEVGERIWGFFPMGTHLLINAGKVNRFAFMDVSAHREGLAPIYAQFQRAAANPLYEPAREEQDSLLRGLFLTSWLCEDALYDQDFYGAGDCLITSASSKTSIALGFAVRDRGTLRSIAITSAGNREFCLKLGCYDEVLSYDEVHGLPQDRSAVLVDMAGDAGVNRAIHQHYGERLRYDCRIGMTHHEAPPATDDDLPGPKPEMFFAPHQAGKRSAEWGADVLEQRIGTSFARFRKFADDWLEIRHFDGSKAAQDAFSAVLTGRASPSEGYTVSLREPG